MNREEYEAIDAVNWSTAKHALKSGLHYKHATEHREADRPAWVFGRASHCAVLEPDRFLRDVVVYPGKVRRGQAWDAFKAEHAGREILKAGERKAIEKMAEVVHAHTEASRLLNTEGRIVEEPMTWIDPQTGIKCKGIPDLRAPGLLLDYKTAATIEFHPYMAAVARYLYAAQLAFYVRGIVANGGERPVCWHAAQEKSSPYDVGCFRITEQDMHAGETAVFNAMHTIAECRRSGAYPGQYPEPVDSELPPWAFGDDDEEITFENEVW